MTTIPRSGGDSTSVSGLQIPSILDTHVVKNLLKFEGIDLTLKEECINKLVERKKTTVWFYRLHLKPTYKPDDRYRGKFLTTPCRHPAVEKHLVRFWHCFITNEYLKEMKEYSDFEEKCNNQDLLYPLKKAFESVVDSIFHPTKEEYPPCMLAPDLKATRKKPSYYEGNYVPLEDFDYNRWIPQGKKSSTAEKDVVTTTPKVDEIFHLAHGFVEFDCSIDAKTANTIIKKSLVFNNGRLEVDTTATNQVQRAFLPGYKAIAYMRHVKWSLPYEICTLCEGEYWGVKANGILCGIEGTNDGTNSYKYPEYQLYWDEKNKQVESQIKEINFL